MLGLANLQIVQAQLLNLFSFLLYHNRWQMLSFCFLIQLVNLLFKIPELAFHLVAALHFVYKVPLKRIDMWIQLEVLKSAESGRSNITELDETKTPKLVYGLMCSIHLDVQLHELHFLGSPELAHGGG